MALIPDYIKKSAEVHEILSDWHNGNIERLKIDVLENKRKRRGFDSFIHLLPGLIDDSYNYASVANNIAEMISMQSTEVDYELMLNKSELYAQDVHLISKNGKIYYLPIEQKV